MANTATLSLGSCVRATTSLSVSPIVYQLPSIEDNTEISVEVNITNNDLYVLLRFGGCYLPFLCCLVYSLSTGTGSTNLNLPVSSQSIHIAVCSALRSSPLRYCPPQALSAILLSTAGPSPSPVPVAARTSTLYSPLNFACVQINVTIVPGTMLLG